MNIVITGHVDHGKSTIIGRLLADTDSLPKGKLEQVKLLCEKNSRPFEYAFLLDALKDEQAQGITIDSARVFFKTAKRRYVIIDAPGHIEFLKNMISGAARADAALLVIDAKEGIRENSRRHGYLLSLLGISQITVLVNKMDLVGYSQAEFDRIVAEFKKFLATAGIQARDFIPVAGVTGENIAHKSTAMPWYTGETVLEILDRFTETEAPEKLALRMPVQGVYKFTENGDDRRIVAGTIESGSLSVGDQVVFYPSGKRSTVRTIEAFSSPTRTRSSAGEATGFTLSEQIYVPRGEMVCRESESKPESSTRFRASIFWLGQNPLLKNRDYVLKLGTARTSVRLEEIIRVVDAATLNPFDRKETIDRHDVAECILKVDRPLSYDLATGLAATSRFVLVDQYDIAGGGIIRESLEDVQQSIRKLASHRNLKWETSFISEEERSDKYGQKPLFLLITGGRESARKEIAKELERQLFNEGRVVYYLGMGSVVHGVSSDLGRQAQDQMEHVRRLGEVGHLLMNAGHLLIVTAVSFTYEDLETLRTLVHSDRIRVVWVGDTGTSDLPWDVLLQGVDLKADLARLKAFLNSQKLL